LKVQYRQTFLKDLKRLQNQPIYKQIFELAFETLPGAVSLADITNVKAIKGYTGRYRVRIGDYRIGLEMTDGTARLMRVLHRKDFYRYFP
jgi:mRNA-degrading endonuclease RelE of RelBE toxin-antitoxin system